MDISWLLNNAYHNGPSYTVFDHVRAAVPFQDTCNHVEPKPILIVKAMIAWTLNAVVVCVDVKVGVVVAADVAAVVRIWIIQWPIKKKTNSSYSGIGKWKSY